MHKIGATLNQTGSDLSVLVIFNDTMNITSISKQDMMLSISAQTSIKFSWSAEYLDAHTLQIKLNVNSALTGSEVLKIKFTNYKVFRGPQGG